MTPFNNRHRGDGAPQHLDQQSSPPRFTDDVSARVSRMIQFEGLRGRSTRASLVFRYISWFLAVMLTSSLTQVLTSGVKNVSGGGWFMLLCSTTICAVGAAATMMYPNIRPEVVHRTRFYVFNVVCLPGTLFAGLIKTSQQWLGDDTLGQTLGLAIPLIFLSTLVLPALVFVKEIIGMRGVSRSRLDDQEAVLLWTRQSDGAAR